MIATMPRETLEARIDFRCPETDRADAESLLQPRETLGDLLREALKREIARRKRAAKNTAK